MLNLIRWIFSYVAAIAVVAAQPIAPPNGDSYGLYSHFDPAMAIVIIVLVCAFFVVGFVSVYIRQCTDYNAAGNGRDAVAAGQRPRMKGLGPAVIESFPVFVYSHVKDLKIGNGVLECAICLSEFGDDETLRLIPKCNHVFHPDCIEAWLEYHVTCPVCRAKLTPDPDSKPVDSIPTATESNSNNTTDSLGGPMSEEGNTEFVIDVNDEYRTRGKITGKFPRSHSTGHSLICPGENAERYTLRFPEEIRKQIMKSGKLKRTRSFTVERKGGDGSSRGRSYIERWMFSRTPPFVTKAVSVKPDKGGEN